MAQTFFAIVVTLAGHLRITYIYSPYHPQIMSTRANIIVKVGETYKGIYCHHDGYPAHAGRILRTHYTTQRNAESLIALGNLSAIAETLDGCKSHYRAYGRSWNDCGAKEARTIESALMASDADYNYIFQDGKWITQDARSGALVK